MLSGVKDADQCHLPTVNHDFSSMFEIHRNPPADIRLHLPQAPVGLLRMPDQHPRFQKGVHQFILFLSQVRA